MTEKYNEIVMVVHPLYNLLLSNIPKEVVVASKTQMSSEEILKYTNLILKDKKNKFKLKQTLQAYGEKILELSKKPNTLVVLYCPVPKNSAARLVFDKIAGRFIEFCNIALKKRFIPMGYIPEQEFSPQIYKKLSKNLKVVAFGDYAQKCRNEWLDYVSLNLDRRGYKVNSEVIDKLSTFVGHQDKEMRGLDNRVNYRTGYQANKLYSKEKNIRRSVAK
ncbi:MAG: hypothetical protein WCX82_02460 [archaeon]|jgi:hypothetical protein